MNIDHDRLCIEIQRLDWARELTDDVIRDIASSADLMEFDTGQVVIELDSQINHVYFIVGGRLDGTLFDQIGKEVYCDSFRRGSVVGLFSMLLPHQSQLRVRAMEHTTVIHLRLDDLLRLTARHHQFQLAMFRVAANLVKQLVLVDRELARPAAVAVVHHSDSSRPLSIELVRRLALLGESPSVAGDDERWQPGNGIPHGLLVESGISIGQQRINQLLKEWRSHGRLFIDIHVERSSGELHRLVKYADCVLWCLRPQDVAAAAQKLQALQPLVPGLRDKVCLVWLLTTDDPAPPFVKELYELAARDFKTCSGDLIKPRQGKLLQQGTQRIVRYLRGVQIGLALGGGAARGMAHLGVLKTLEDQGIFVDMLAGTSAGAMVGGMYASGLDPQHAVSCFKNDLLPPWLFRKLPGGGYWYLLYKYRRRQFEPMLRKYLGHLRMEQLAIPVTMISVDLVDGVPLVRERGDATANMLESINLPPLSLPIVGSEQAIVDGGLLNNVPANVLVERGCNFVIASTVTANLERDFMGIRSKKAQGLARFIATVQVIMRQNMILNHSMNAVGVQAADVVIAPDVTHFDISEFTRADEMAVVGEAAAGASIQQLKAMLSKLDPKLFP